MSVNGVTNSSAVTNAYSNYTSTAKNTKSETEETKKPAQKTYTPDTNLVAKLKADADMRAAQLQSMVEKLLTTQGETYNNANDIWSILRSGNFTVDPATKAQAQADIAEDGYWGVKQTSQRILDFATALTGGDPSKIDAMKAAFEKGYKQAQKIWGGELPEISKKTYDAVLKGFDDMKANASAEPEA